MKKFILLFLAFLFSLIQPQQISPFQKIFEEVKKSGWKASLLDEYSFLLNNSKYSVAREAARLKELKISSERTFLYSLLLKREGKFREMYDSLYTGLKKNPVFFDYYNELNFAVTATGQSSILEAYLMRNKVVEPYASYLKAQFKALSNDYEASIGLLEKALTSNPHNNELLLELASLYRRTGNSEYSFKLLDKIEASITKDDKLSIPLQILRGNILFAAQDYKNALKYLNAASLQSKISKDVINYSRSIVYKGIVLDITGQKVEAKKLFNEALSVSQEINYYEGIALASSELGVAYSYDQDLIKAKSLYLKSYDIYKKTGNRLRLALLSENLGKLYLAMYDYSSAIKCYQDGIQLAGENKRAQVLNLNGLAELNFNLSDFAKAIGYYKQSEKIATSARRGNMRTSSLIGIGRISLALNNPGDALYFFNAADSIVTKQNNELLKADLLNKIGVCYTYLGNKEKAEKYLSDAVLLFKNSSNKIGECTALKDLAFLYNINGHKQKAFQIISKCSQIALSLNNKPLLSEVNLLLGICSQDFTSAKIHFLSALNNATASNNFQIKTEALTSLAELCQNNNLMAQAKKYYQNAVDLIEDSNCPLFSVDNKRKIYRSYAGFLVKYGDPETAFLILERSAEIGNLNSLISIKLQSLIKDKSLLDRLFEYEWMVHSELYKNSDSVISLYYNLRNILILKYPDTKNYLNIIPDKTIRDYQQKLNTDQAILRFYPGDKSTSLFLLTKNNFYSSVSAIGINEIRQQMLKTFPNYSGYSGEISNRLYTVLFKDILSNLATNSKLIILPPNEFSAFPFETLLTGIENNQSIYLLNKYIISYAPSLSVLFHKKENPTDFKHFIEGDPFIDQNIEYFKTRHNMLGAKPLQKLTNTNNENKTVERILNNTSARVGKNASETNFKNAAENKSILHLSTYAFLSDLQPLIIFSNFYDPDNDGFLEASEIAAMNLNNDLVVLSACQKTNDTLFSSSRLTNAFFEAGAGSIVFNLWNERNDFTVKLLSLFYENLKAGQNKSDALRNAKLDFIKNYSPNPLDWGAFIISGNTDKIEIKPAKPYSWYWYLLIPALLALLIYYLSRGKRA